MYVAAQHRISPVDALRRAAAHGVGELVTSGVDDGKGAPRLDATRLPFLVQGLDALDASDERDDDAALEAAIAAGAVTIETHLSRVNTQWRDRHALLVVTCANTHIAGTDMPPEPEGARFPRVPTWNYLTVHVRGELVAHPGDAAWTERHLRSYVERFEDEWRIEEHSSLDLVRHAFPALVGVELRVTEVEGKAKLSQSLHSPDLAHTIASLRRRGTPDAVAVADLMDELAVPYVAAREARVAAAHPSAHTSAPEDGPEF